MIGIFYVAQECVSRKCRDTLDIPALSGAQPVPQDDGSI